MTDDVLMKALKTTQDQGAVGWARYYAMVEALRSGDIDEAVRLAEEDPTKYDVKRSRAYETGDRAGLKSARGMAGLCTLADCPRVVVSRMQGLCADHYKQSVQREADEKQRRIALAQEVECPHCGVSRGSECRSPSGPFVGDYGFHADRLRERLGLPTTAASGNGTNAIGIRRISFDWEKGTWWTE